jgi:hypothetical protein
MTVAIDQASGSPTERTGRVEKNPDQRKIFGTKVALKQGFWNYRDKMTPGIEKDFDQRIIFGLGIGNETSSSALRLQVPLRKLATQPLP